MASKQTTSLLAEVEALKPSSRLECFILFFHCLVQDEGFLNTHVHDMAVTTTARSLPDVWNSSSSCFSFQYEREEIQYYMRALPIDHEVILHFDKKASKSSSRQIQKEYEPLSVGPRFSAPDMEGISLEQLFSSLEVQEVLKEVSVWEKLRRELITFIHQEGPQSSDRTATPYTRGVEPEYSPLRIPGSGRPQVQPPRGGFDPFEGAIGR